LILEEDQDDQKIAKWVTVHPPISGPFSPVAERATGQTVHVPRTRETVRPPRTAGTPNGGDRPDCAKVTNSRCSPTSKTVREVTGPPHVRILASWPTLANNAKDGQ
ncbi:hypothetical protein ABZ904_50905, partial [Streptomyces sp. NPDC046900]|uniref:hypothetical protein n=1 Tax=Streptomyces sp. NPDC046900 TaxID=3155473 RepID=UPI0033F610F5